MDRATRNLVVNRLKKLDRWSFDARAALYAAEEQLQADGCDCGDASDVPCALCQVQYALKTFPKCGE